MMFSVLMLIVVDNIRILWDKWRVVINFENDLRSNIIFFILGEW